MARCPKCHHKYKECVECHVADICECTGKARCTKCRCYRHVGCMDGPLHAGYCQRPGDH